MTMGESVPAGKQQRKAEGAQQRRVSFEVGPNASSDHPLLTLRKRMEAGDNRTSISTFGRSSSITATGEIAAAVDAAARQDNLENLLEEAESLGLTHKVSSFVTPAPTAAHVSLPTLTPPRTPGRQHDITWDSEPPKFFPRPKAQLTPYTVDAASPTTVTVLKRKSDDTVSDTMRNSPLPKVQLRPRFESSFLLDRLNMPSLSEEEQSRSGCPPIPFAPFQDDPASSSDDETRGDSEEASATTKLSEMSLSVSEAVRQNHVTRKHYARKGVNARCA